LKKGGSGNIPKRDGDLSALSIAIRPYGKKSRNCDYSNKKREGFRSTHKPQKNPKKGLKNKKVL